MKNTITTKFHIGNKTVTLPIVFEWFHEPNYGADADGNRGISTWFLDDAFYEIPDNSDEGVVLSEEDKRILTGMIEGAIDNTNPGEELYE